MNRKDMVVGLFLCLAAIAICRGAFDHIDTVIIRILDAVFLIRGGR